MLRSHHAGGDDTILGVGSGVGGLTAVGEGRITVGVGVGAGESACAILHASDANAKMPKTRIIADERGLVLLVFILV